MVMAVYDPTGMARPSRTTPAIAEEKVRDDIRRRVKARLDEWQDDPIPDEPRPDMRDAARRAVTYSAPVPIR
jgi:hypothetical protein